MIETTNPGYVAAELYESDPNNEIAPDPFHHEFDRGVNSRILSQMSGPGTAQFSRYLVGPADQAPYQTVQAAVDAALSDGGKRLIPILPGDWVGSVAWDVDGPILVGFGGWSDDDPTSALTTRILGDVTISDNTDKTLAFKNLLINGKLSISGSGDNDLYINDVQVINDSDVAFDWAPAGSNSFIIGHNCRFICPDDTQTPFVASGVCNIELKDCEFLRNGLTPVANPSFDYSSGGAGVRIWNSAFNGPIVRSGGTASLTMRGAGTYVQVSGVACIQKNAGSGSAFILGGNYFGSTVISGGSSGDNFVSQPQLSFGTTLNESIVTKIAVGGDVAYTPADTNDWTGADPTTVIEAIDRMAAALGPIA